MVWFLIIKEKEALPYPWKVDFIDTVSYGKILNWGQSPWMQNNDVLVNLIDTWYSTIKKSIPFIHT